MSEQMAAKAMHHAIWAFAENYTGIADAATHPMLIQIAKRMINKSQHKSSLKFVLYSGHDSTVTPLLINLHDRIQDGLLMPHVWFLNSGEILL